MIDWTCLFADLCPPATRQRIHHSAAHRAGLSVEPAAESSRSSHSSSTGSRGSDHHSPRVALLLAESQRADGDAGHEQQQPDADANVHSG